MFLWLHLHTVCLPQFRNEVTLVIISIGNRILLYTYLTIKHKINCFYLYYEKRRHGSQIGDIFFIFVFIMRDFFSFRSLSHIRYFNVWFQIIFTVWYIRWLDACWYYYIEVSIPSHFKLQRNIIFNRDTSILKYVSLILYQVSRLMSWLL